jgi:hypothetical protein
VIDLADPVARALSLVNERMPYEYGTGDYHPKHLPDGTLLEDRPWTSATRDDGMVVTGSDCAGFAICWCHKLTRHRPGFNHGPHATVSDDINTDSSVEDALGARTLFTPVIAPSLGIAEPVRPGDLLVYKSIHLDGHKPWIGHVSIIVAIEPGFDPTRPDWMRLTVAQCCGGNGRIPAVLRTDGYTWRRHDITWGRDPAGHDVPERRSVVIRVAPAQAA